jgi:thymidylate synthase ThyX
MIIIDTHPQVLSHIKVDITFQDLEQKIKNADNHPEILQIAEKTLDKAKGIWRPEAVFQWFEFNHKGKDNFGSVIPNSGGLLMFDFGYSIKFLTHASHALVAVYTAGQELGAASKKVSENGHIWIAIFLTLLV